MYVECISFEFFLIVQSPLQQGLKHMVGNIIYLPVEKLIVQSPLQQGLKRFRKN